MLPGASCAQPTGHPVTLRKSLDEVFVHLSGLRKAVTPLDLEEGGGLGR